MWEEVIIDDFFPVLPNSCRPAFNHSRKNELWVMILEKAWAKVHGGYLNINSGLTREALHDLTGAPCITYFIHEDTEDGRWNTLYNANRNKYIMTAGTLDLMGDGTDQQEKKTGIVGSHAYSLLAAVELVEQSPGKWRKLKDFEQTNKNTIRLIRLRNPWGKGEWKGEWCNSDKRWNPELKKELGHNEKEDGVFFMPFSAYSQLFSDFQVCYYRDDYKYSCVRLNTEMHQHCYFSFEVTKPGEYYFTLNQINKRFFQKDRGYAYSSCTMTVGRLDTNGQITYVGAMQKADKEAWLEANCIVGKYYCSVYTPWKSFVDEITISSYGPGELQFNPINESKIQKNYYHSIVASKSVSSNDSAWKNFSQQNEPKIKYKFEHGGDGFGFFNFINDSESTSMTVSLEFTKTQNIKPLYPYTFDNPMLIVPPKSNESFVYFMVDTPSSIAFKMFTSFKKNSKRVETVTKRDGQKFIRKYKNQDVGIYVYA